jgi:hypothetical protein
MASLGLTAGDAQRAGLAAGQNPSAAVVFFRQCSRKASAARVSLTSFLGDVMVAITVAAGRRKRSIEMI